MSDDGDLMTIIREEIAAALASQERSRPRFSPGLNQRTRNQSRRRSGSSGLSRQEPNQEGVCWYHQRFGDDAQKCRLPCTAGKRPGQSLVATNTAGQQTGRLLFVTDRKSKIRFLVETGAEVSIIPPSNAERKTRQDTFGLLAANGPPIVTYGTRSLTLNLGLRRTFRWVFIVAKVRNPILGADFLKHHGLVVDMGHKRLADTRTNLSVQGVISASPSLSPLTLPKQQSSDYTAILREFPAITQACSKDRPI